MRRHLVSAGVAVIVGVLAAGVTAETRQLSPGSFDERPQTPAPDAPQTPAPSPEVASARLSGPWQFDSALSTGIPTGDALTGAAGRQGSSGSGGSTGGGGGGMGGRGGGRGYGGGGGMGGMGGGRGGGGSRGGSSMSSEQTLETRALLREFYAAPDRLIVTAAKDSLSTTDGDGLVRKYNVNGKKEKVDLTTAKVEITTSWSGSTVTQAAAVGQLKLVRVLQVSDEGNKLIIDVGPDPGTDKNASGASTPAGGRAAAPMHLVYDKAQ